MGALKKGFQRWLCNLFDVFKEQAKYSCREHIRNMYSKLCKLKMCLNFMGFLKSCLMAGDNFIFVESKVYNATGSSPWQLLVFTYSPNGRFLVQETFPKREISIAAEISIYLSASGLQASS